MATTASPLPVLSSADTAASFRSQRSGGLTLSGPFSPSSSNATQGFQLPKIDIPQSQNPFSPRKLVVPGSMEYPSEYFLDDARYCRREVLEENVLDVELLKRIEFFRSFGEEFLNELMENTESIRKVLYLPDTVIVREGSQGDSMMVISKGQVDISVNGKVVKRLGEGSYFGELVFLGASLFRTATVTTVTFCDVRIIYSKSFKQIAAKYPPVKAALTKFASKKGSFYQNGSFNSKAFVDALGHVFRQAQKEMLKRNALEAAKELEEITAAPTPRVRRY